MWHRLLDMCNHVSLSNDPTKVTWTLTKSRVSQVKSLCTYMLLDGCCPLINDSENETTSQFKAIMQPLVGNRLLLQDNLVNTVCKGYENGKLSGRNDIYNDLFSDCPLAIDIIGVNVVGTWEGTSNQLFSSIQRQR